MRIGSVAAIDSRVQHVLHTIPAQQSGTLDGEPIVLEVTLVPMPIDKPAEIECRLPTPRAPRKALRDASGALVRYPKDAGAMANAPVMDADTDDPAYKAALGRNNVLQGVAMFIEATEASGDIEWSTPHPTGETTPEGWRTFYQARLDELIAFGLPMGAVLRAVNRVMELQGMNPDKLEGLAQDRFPADA